MFIKILKTRLEFVRTKVQVPKGIINNHCMIKIHITVLLQNFILYNVKQGRCKVKLTKINIWEVRPVQ